MNAKIQSKDTDHTKRNEQIMIHFTPEVWKCSNSDEADGALCSSHFPSQPWFTHSLTYPWHIFYFLNVSEQQVVNMKPYFFRSPLPDGLQ